MDVSESNIDEKRPSQIRAAFYMMGSRLICMAIGLIGIPIILKYLSPQGFSAWALLYGASFIFYALEIGLPLTVVKFIVAAQGANMVDEAGRALSNALMQQMLLYAIGLLVLMPVAAPVAQWLDLPDTTLFSSAGLLYFVFIAVASCSLVKLGATTLQAIRRFDLVAWVAILQTLVSSVLAWIAAWMWGRLDLVLIAYWGGQFAVLLIAAIWAYNLVPWRFRFQDVRFSTMLSMALHGVNLQFQELAFFVHFQFDKMVIAGMVGLGEVAHYEIASRAGQALRNLPVSGLGSLLPSTTARYADGTEIWPVYLKMTRAAMHGAIFFLFIPIIIAPLFLFAWVGQIGYHGRWVFMMLAVGIASGVVVMPVSLFVQAMGRTVLESWVSFLAMSVNALLTFLLIRHWGKEGAAAATAIAMLTSNIAYMYAFHALYRKRFRDTAIYLLKWFWPFLPVAALWMMLERFIEPIVISSRWYMAPASLALAAGCVLTLLVAYALTGKLGEDERTLLKKIAGLRWFS